MATTVELTAEAKYGYEGKQFVARITGRDAKFTFARQFLGRKGGKRGESTSVDVDETGLYVTRDIDRKGNADETFWLVYAVGSELYFLTVEATEAMGLAKALDVSREEYDRQALAAVVAALPALIAKNKAKAAEFAAIAADESKHESTRRNAQQTAEESAARAASQEQRLALLERELVTADDPRAAALAQVKALMAQHGITAAEVA